MFIKWPIEASALNKIHLHCFVMHPSPFRRPDIGAYHSSALASVASLSSSSSCSHLRFALWFSAALTEPLAAAAVQRRCSVLICSGDESPGIRCTGTQDVQPASTATLNRCLLTFYHIVHFHYALFYLYPTQVWCPHSGSPCPERKPADVKAPPLYLPDHQPAVFWKKPIEWQEGGQHEAFSVLFWVFFSPRCVSCEKNV